MRRKKNSRQISSSQKPPCNLPLVYILSVIERETVHFEGVFISRTFVRWGIDWGKGMHGVPI